MKQLTTVLIVILIIVLGRWITTLDGFTYRIFMSSYLMFITGLFTYGVYKLLEDLEK